MPPFSPATRRPEAGAARCGLLPGRGEAAGKPSRRPTTSPAAISPDIAGLIIRLRTMTGDRVRPGPFDRVPHRAVVAGRLSRDITMLGPVIMVGPVGFEPTLAGS